jgi:hypothetical protein
MFDPNLFDPDNFFGSSLFNSRLFDPTRTLKRRIANEPCGHSDGARASQGTGTEIARTRHRALRKKGLP